MPKVIKRTYSVRDVPFCFDGNAKTVFIKFVIAKTISRWVFESALRKNEFQPEQANILIDNSLIEYNQMEDKDETLSLRERGYFINFAREYLAALSDALSPIERDYFHLESYLEELDKFNPMVRLAVVLYNATHISNGVLFGQRVHYKKEVPTFIDRVFSKVAY